MVIFNSYVSLPEGIWHCGIGGELINAFCSDDVFAVVSGSLWFTCSAFRSSSQWLILSPEIYGMMVPHCGFALLFCEIVRQIDKLEVKQQFFYGSFMIHTYIYI